MVEPGGQTRFPMFSKREAEVESTADIDQQIGPEIPVQGVAFRVIQSPVEPGAQIEDKIQGEPVTPQECTLREAIQVDDIAQPGNPVIMKRGQSFPADADPEVREAVQGGVRAVFFRRLVTDSDSGDRIDESGHHLVPPVERRRDIGDPTMHRDVPLGFGRGLLLRPQSCGHQQGDEDRPYSSGPAHQPDQGRGTPPRRSAQRSMKKL